MWLVSVWFLTRALRIWLTIPAQAAEKSLEELKSIRVSEAQFGRGEIHQ